MYTVELKVYEKYIYYDLDKQYIGLLSFNEGQLSDFRAIIRKNRWKITPQSFYKLMRTGLFELLTHYLAEVEYMGGDQIQAEKNKIVKSTESVLKEAEKSVLKNKYLEVDNDS